MKMYSFTGGGIGVIDFDNDGWPDIACTQGGDWDRPESPDFNDRLFRNLDGERFGDVSPLAGLDTAGFSQGVACGDVNNDGWADIYVARIGRNALYLNNGDGTFSDATESLGPAVARWTTSCLIADLDGDGNSDLLDVNYLTGDGVFTNLCNYRGHRRACFPGKFASERDDLWVNAGDATFRLAEELGSGFSDDPRPGLGTVAADFDESGKLSVFVANDSLANWYYRLEREEDSSLVVRDSAGLQGLRADRDGRAQACMGVACSDADGDGELDIFVTNYFQEHNTLYLSQDFGFVDSSRECGLFTPSLPLLGFGTQFLDADLDGWDDLIVVNGHVDDFRFDGTPFRMPAQFFRNGGGSFSERSEDSGPYFQKQTLGRSTAVVDWNRDGLPDVAVMHLDDPLALLTNTSQRTGQSLIVRLVATTTQRDAIGTRVKVQLQNGRELTRQLVAGSGYQAGNEPALVFGLGNNAAISSVEVRWPSGTTTMMPPGLKPGSEIVLVEGAGWSELP